MKNIDLEEASSLSPGPEKIPAQSQCFCSTLTEIIKKTSLE